MHLLADRKLPRDPDSEAASGVVHAALELARAQVDLGHEAFVAAVDKEPWQEEWRGVRLIGLRQVRWARVRVNGRELDLSQHMPYVLFTGLHGFDVAQAHHNPYMRFLRARARVAHFHADPFERGSGNGSHALRPADFASIAQHSDAQVAASHFVAREVERGLNGSGHVRTVYNGVEAHRFDPLCWGEEASHLRRQWGVSQGDVVFLFAGAIVPEKGVIHLARVFARLADRLPSVHLVMAGAAELWGGALQPPSRHNADYEESIRTALQAPLMAGRVHLLGKVSPSQMPSLYAASDALVVPSVYREPFGMVALEAMASGRPVIASATGGLPEIVSERTGRLVVPGDEAELEGAMDSLAEQPDLRHRLGLAAQREARRFSWEAAARDLDDIYQSILAKQVSK
ncbi:MAG: glycosyltransferase family 4 protein [Chloroflexi bacterium]|nr:glycosyltransferase family 4 protein [Chloroflexota bacterium]